MSRNLRSSRIWAAALLLSWLAVVALVAILVGQSRRHGDCAARLAAVETEKQKLAAEREAVTRENEALRARLIELGEQPPPAPPAGASPLPVSNLEQARLLVKVQDELASAQRALAEAEARWHELEDKAAKAQEENKVLQAALDESREKLASQSRVLEALQAELKSSSDRLVQLETTNLLLHKQNRQAADESARVRSLLGQLEEINRRRENTLGNILRRYRELTDQLRGLTVRPDRAPEGPGAEMPELSRLQTALASTEDELRQLSNLNAQAARLQRQLTGR